jgi:hypothetical protein
MHYRTDNSNLTDDLIIAEFIQMHEHMRQGDTAMVQV